MRRRTGWLLACLVVLAIVCLAVYGVQLPGVGRLLPPGVAPTPAASSPSGQKPAPDKAVREKATFVSVIDGDTIKSSAGKVRLLGIDTPERGECGYDAASKVLKKLLSRGDRLTLELPAGENDEDEYGRLIRYVATADGVDLGLKQLQKGNAVARYDSWDGYPEHPREADYRAAQLATLSPEGSVITTTCRGKAAASVAPAEPHDSWWESYSSCGRLKRNPGGHPTGPFARDDPAQAVIYDWFANRTGNHGDGDGDGLACE